MVHRQAGVVNGGMNVQYIDKLTYDMITVRNHDCDPSLQL